MGTGRLVNDVMIVTSGHKRNYSPSLDSRPLPSTGTLSSSWPGSTRSPRSRRPWSPTTGEVWPGDSMMPRHALQVGDGGPLQARGLLHLQRPLQPRGAAAAQVGERHDHRQAELGLQVTGHTASPCDMNPGVQEEHEAGGRVQHPGADQGAGRHRQLRRQPSHERRAQQGRRHRPDIRGINVNVINRRRKHKITIFGSGTNEADGRLADSKWRGYLWNKSMVLINQSCNFVDL